MNEPIRKYMKVGLVHFMAYPTTIRGEGPVAETVRKVVLDDCFEAIEIITVKNPGERAAVKKCSTRHT